MKKELINEILRIKVLSGYDTQNTLTENTEIILERTTFKTLAKDARYLESLAPELDDILKMTGPLGAKGMFKNADDVIFALKNGSMSSADLGKLNHAILKTSKNPALKRTAANWVVSTPTFMKGFSSGTAVERLAKLKEFNPNMSDDMIKQLHTANELRLKNLGKSGKNVKGVKSAGQGTKEVGQGTKEVGQGTKQSETVINQTFHIGGEGGAKAFRNQEEYVRYMNQYGDEFAKTYGRDLDDLARANGHENFRKWMRVDEEGALNAIKTESKAGRGTFGKLIDWTKRVFKWKTLWGLAKIAGVSWLAWYLFFKKDGFKVECESGTHWGGEGIGCIPDKKTDDDNKDDDNKDEGGGGEGGTIGPDGNKYIECTAPYYKGCVGQKGDENIKKAQDCLGVTPNGFFTQETEDALYKKINKKSFSPSDLPTICAKSSGSSLFQI